GTNLHQITSDPNFVLSPEDMVWSPDSTRLVYSSDIANATRICNADGSNIQNFPVRMEYIDWSPDGTKFVYAAYTGTTAAGVNVWQVFVINADGTGLTQLTNTPDSHGGPSWSRDGTKIVFVDSTTTASTNMFTMNPDGSGVAPLLNAYIYYCYQPCWH
ncbi:MAG TPA: hypothetical protein VN963_07025, partial [bacterium]|nr:hypothetical protein [bacterium]